MRLAAALTLLLAAHAGADEYHTCRLPDGRIEMRDTPCPANAQEMPAHPGRVTVLPRPDPEPPQPAPRWIGPGRDLGVRRAPPEPHPVKATPFVDPDWDAGFLERMVLRARLSGVVASLHNLRNASMMYNAEQDGWPARAEDMGLDGSNMQTNEIADVHFLSDGTILARLKPGFGTDKFVGMIPVEELGGAQLGWKCVANFPEPFLQGGFGSTCESRAIAMPGAVQPAAARE